MEAMSRQPYKGTHRKLLVAIDVGTTHSGVSYSILDPGIVPVINTVTRYPGHGTVGEGCKVPTVLYYDRNGTCKCAGAETESQGLQDTAARNGWIRVEWFKLHLRPPNMPTQNAIRPLPLNLSVEQVFADFLKYLFECTEKFIRESHALLWRFVEDSIVFVLAHPNGWGGKQQARMRNAAVLAGMVPDNEAAQSRILFVTEGEASLHFCINKGLSTAPLELGEGIIILDAGGGTLDISAYKGSERVYTEIAAPQCHFQGSTFITSRASDYITDYLESSENFRDHVSYIVESFDERGKHGFRDEGEDLYIQFASPRENEPAHNIRNGRLRLPGRTVASFFEPTILCIEQAIEEQVQSSHHPISSIFLVGGFAASEYLYSTVKARLQKRGLSVYRPDSHVNKAVSQGAASFHLDHFVTTRVSQLWYGSECNLSLDPSNPVHMARVRQGKARPNPLDGRMRLPGHFSVILPKNEQVSETREYRDSFFRLYDAESSRERTISTEVVYYQDQSQAPAWVDEIDEPLKTLCTITADMSKVKAVTKYSIDTGCHFIRLDFDIVLMFGLTELRAQIAWKEGGAEKRGPAKIIYD